MSDSDTPRPPEAHTPPADDPRPQRPVEPDAIDCCGEGCVPCIYDLYDEALEKYREALAAWLARHPGES
ncbi:MULTISPECIES: oxidoreductase-like domain-containing protein [Dyella]|uniref:Oxidoreductase-like domain-containing protein n=2 Tax=Dyella TaxID=231454 RepID=A0A4R0Z2W5_9GAMM|nr:MULTISPECIES: oxidoreductase-like domain-containing protein [Dyella]TBR39770.1 hypothetical protein EYV96_06170 [Dyella terrae]TCI12650.1 hypothetical protein EZM97_04700 [Dyella soli]